MDNNNDFKGLFSNMFNRAASRTDKVTGTINQTFNSEKAKKTRKKLLTWGGIGIGVGVALLIAGIVLSVYGSVSGFDSGSFSIPTLIIVSIPILIVGGIITAVGSYAIHAGLAVVITGFASKTLDMSKHCPNCGDVIDQNEKFCNKCGANLRNNKLCECGTQNDVNDQYCRNCGKKL